MKIIFFMLSVFSTIASAEFLPANAGFLQGFPVLTTVPANNQCLIYSTSGPGWAPGNCAGGSGTGFKAVGQATLAAGTVTVTNASIATGSKIFLTYATIGGTPGVLSVGTITDATSFVINSSSTLDTSVVNWGFL